VAGLPLAGTPSRLSRSLRDGMAASARPTKNFLIARNAFGLANRPSMSLTAPATRRIDGAPFRIGIVAARFNEALVDGLLARVDAGLRASRVKAANITVVRVPGSHEVPWAAQALARRSDCVIGLGVLIAGDTSHHEMVGASVSQALQGVALATRVPMINGVLVVNSLAQAKARCTGKINRGAEFAAAALEMAALKWKFSR
jgi:6,7-dimethyl-8-ribityllumazine synthase